MTASSSGQQMATADVVVVGGGPVGLAAAFLLGRQGLNVQLVERRRTTTQLPKGQFVHASSAELYRQWGIIDSVRAGGWPFSRSNGQGMYLSLREGPVGSSLLWDGDEAGFRDWYRAFTPEYPQFVPASIYEAVLHEAAARWPTVTIAFGHEATEIAQDDAGVQIVARGADGAELAVRARYLIAADGNTSFVRRALGIEEDLGADFGQQVVTEFYGPLEQYVGTHPYFQYWVVNPRCAGWFGSRHPQTGQWRYNYANPEGEPFSPETVTARIRAAVGDPEFPIDIVAINQFRYSTALTRQWRRGRVFLAGDSAHRFAPWGGFGANLGLQEINNLAWKLALVLKGEAGEALLDTYEVERKGKASATLKVASYNTYVTQGMIAASLAMEGPHLARGGLSGEALTFLEQTLPLGREAGFAHVGHQFGTLYESPAIVADGTTPPKSPVGAYHESASPGARAPHLWLITVGGSEIAVQDLYEGGFVLLVHGEAAPWRTAVTALGVDAAIAVHGLGRGGELTPASDRWERFYGLAEGGAVLIRPDGFVGARFIDPPADVAATLGRVIDTILARRSGGHGVHRTDVGEAA